METVPSEQSQSNQRLWLTYLQAFLELQLYVYGVLISVLYLLCADVLGKRHTSFPLSKSAYPNLGASVHARLLQSPWTLCDPVDCSWPGFSVHGIFQERILELVAMPSSRGSFRPRNLTCVSCIAGRFFTAEPPGKPNSGGMRQNNL